MSEHVTELDRLEHEAVFAEPWEARAFAMAVHLMRTQRIDYGEFRRYLIAEIGASQTEPGSSAYYRAWLNAFERLLIEKRLLFAPEIAARAAELAAAPPPEPGQNDYHDHAHDDHD